MANGDGGRREGAARKKGLPNVKQRARLIEDLVDRGEDR